MKVPREDIEAFDPISGKKFKNWDALVAALTNGFVVVVLSDRPNTYPLVYGPWPTKVEATKARVRIRNRVAQSEKPHKVHSFVRHAWKDPS